MHDFRVRVPADIKAPAGKRTIQDCPNTKDAAEARGRFTHRYARANRETLAPGHGIDNEYSDAITGHEDDGPATSYGAKPMKALFREILELPRDAVSGVEYKAPDT